MSNYSQTTFFTPKDTLPSGNPAKTIFGAAYDVEFGNISVAIASKLDATAGPFALLTGAAFTGAVTVATTFGVTGATTLTGAVVAQTTLGVTGVSTFTGQAIFNAISTGLGAASVLISSTLPELEFNATGSAVDAKGWQMLATGNTFIMPTVNDAHNAGNNIFLFTRTGAGNTNMSFGSVANNTTYTFLGTGNGIVTGNWSFTGTASGAAITAQAGATQSAIAALGVNSSYALTVQGGLGAGVSFGESISGGTTSADVSLNVQNAAASVAYFQVRGDGRIAGGGTVAAALVDMTPDTGTFTGTFTGFTAGVTGTCIWYRIGKLVMLMFPTAGHGTSNATSFTMTGLPAAIQPPTNGQIVAVDNNSVTDNSALGSSTTKSMAASIVASGGTITFLITGSASSWTNVGTKGFANNTTISYLLV